MITSDYCMQESVFRIAQNAEKKLKKQTVDQMADQIMQLPERTKIQLLAPVVRGKKGYASETVRTASNAVVMYVYRLTGVCMN